MPHSHWKGQSNSNTKTKSRPAKSQNDDLHHTVPLHTLNNKWSIPSWMSLKASLARRRAGAWLMSASKILCNSLSTPSNFAAGAMDSLLCQLFLGKQTLSPKSKTCGENNTTHHELEPKRNIQNWKEKAEKESYVVVLLEGICALVIGKTCGLN